MQAMTRRELFGKLAAAPVAAIGAVAATKPKWQHLAMPPGDARFLATRRFCVSEIARVFNCPPHRWSNTAG